MDGSLDRARLHLETGYVLDAAGRLLATNEQSNINAIAPPPLVLLLRTSEGTIWATRADLPVALHSAIDRMFSAEPVAEPDDRPPRCRSELLARLAHYASVWSESAGPVYAFPSKIAAPESVVAVTTGNSDILRTHYPDILADLAVSQPCFAQLRGGTAVSVCFSARRGARAHAAGVVTLPEERGRGHAAAVTAAWARAVRQLDKTPLYSTDWENHSSRAVAARLGLRAVASEWTLFDAPVRLKNHP
jgi:hypothetical protein